MRHRHFKTGPVTHKEPGNGLPKFVKEVAAKRGYADAEQALSLYVMEDDIANAFECAGHGDGTRCVMAQAGQRLGAKAVYFYRTTAWVDFGTGPIVRFATSKTIYKNIIDPFDRGDRQGVVPGIYPLTPPCDSKSLKRRRQYAKTDRKQTSAPRKVVAAHTERVVMASKIKP